MNCGLCKKVCSFQGGYEKSQDITDLHVYAVKHKDEDVRKSSTSGGAFTAISDYVLDKNGVIYGVAFDDEFDVEYQRATTREHRDRFRGSKYVQCDLNSIFKQVKTDLSKGVNTLFTGTPCQCAGLKSYLNMTETSTQHLVLCDIVCHGTPSPILWREHIESCKARNKSKIKRYNCRSKVEGWHEQNDMVVYENGKVDYKTASSQEHRKIYFLHTALRPACHECKYTNLQRCSDITIADFWGIEESFPEFDDNKGVSLMLLNTLCGNRVFNEIKHILDYKRSNPTDCLQPQLQYPTRQSPKRNEFWNDYYSKGYRYIVRKYTDCGYKQRVKAAIRGFLKKTRLLKIAIKISRAKTRLSESSVV